MAQIKDTYQSGDETGAHNPNQSFSGALQGIHQDQKEEQVKVTAKELGWGYANLMTTPVNPDCLVILKRSEMEQARIIPILRVGKRLHLAIVDHEGHLKNGIIQYLEERGFAVEPVLISEESFEVGRKMFDQYGIHDPLEAELTHKVEVYEQELEHFKTLANTIEQQSPSDALRTMLQEAYATQASDVHIDPQENGIYLRFRIDGMVQDIFRISTEFYKQFLNQLKYECHMKMNVSHIPQDGRLTFQVTDGKVDVRISTLPTIFGEALALRLLDTKKKLFTLGELGFVDPVLHIIQEGLKAPQGMILVVGPTGSGKTTSLYTIIKTLQRPENRIITLEDPIEYQLNGISQSQIEPDKGYDFITGLKALVRQDPDVIMVGEIREKETAEIAFQASLTGHIVLTSLHAGNVVESVSRLQNIGLKPFMIAPALQLIIAQRLVRKVCEHCKVQRNLSAHEQEIISQIPYLAELLPTFSAMISEASKEGCSVCSHTGYKGRTVIAEALRVDENFRQLVADQVSGKELLAYLQKQPNYLSMHEYGFLRILQGVTTFGEVYRVTGGE